MSEPLMMNRRGLVAYLAGMPLVLAGCQTPPSRVDFDQSAVELKKDLDKLIKASEPVKGPISLYEAMARALKYNLDKQIELMDEALKAKQLKVKRFDMLPSVVAGYGWNGRNNEAASRSKSLRTGNESLESSTSSEQYNTTADLTVSWDVLDFGLAYVRARQQANEASIALERRRKVINRIIEDVRTAYWRAVSADRTFKRLVAVEAMAQKALAQSAELEARRIVSPLTVLSYQRDLLQVQGEVQKLQRELTLSKIQLAALMNLPPDTSYTLVLPDRTDVVPELPGSANEMIMVALRYRPEMHESELRQSSLELEKDAAFLRRLPSVKAILGLNHDSNQFVYNNDWLSLSSRVSWNLISLFRGPAEREALDTELMVVHQRDLALTLAIMTQTHVARVRFIRLTQELNTNKRSQTVQSRITALSRNGFKARSVSQQNLVREEMNDVLAEVRYDVAYADLQNAYANLYASMGLDNFDEDINDKMGIQAIAEKLEEHWQDRASTLPPMPVPKS